MGYQDEWDRTQERIAWYAKMSDAYKNFPETIKRELDEWQRINSDKDVGQWPEWERYIGKKP